MNEEKNIEESFTNFFKSLEDDTLSLREARLIFRGSETVCGFLNIVFDFHIKNKVFDSMIEPKRSRKKGSFTENILGGIDSDLKTERVIRLGEKDFVKRKKRQASSFQSSRVWKKNMISKDMYRNHFLCSALSEILLSLLMPHKMRHCHLFLKGK